MESHKPEQWPQVFQFPNFNSLLYKNGYESGDFVLQAGAYDCCRVPCIRVTPDIV